MNYREETVLQAVSHIFLAAHHSVRFQEGVSNAILINGRVLVSIKWATSTFHDNASQFTATNEWLTQHEDLALDYDLFIACYCRQEKRFCVLSWKEFKSIQTARLKSFKLEAEDQFPFRIEQTSAKGFSAFALGGGRRKKRVGEVKKATGLITKEIKGLLV